jgi:hypothetical protein
MRESTRPVVPVLQRLECREDALVSKLAESHDDDVLRDQQLSRRRRWIKSIEVCFREWIVQI